MRFVFYWVNTIGLWFDLTKRSNACDYSKKETDEDKDETLVIDIDKYSGNINSCLLAPASTSITIIIISYMAFNSM